MALLKLASHSWGNTIKWMTADESMTEAANNIVSRLMAGLAMKTEKMGIEKSAK